MSQVFVHCLFIHYILLVHIIIFKLIVYNDSVLCYSSTFVMNWSVNISLILHDFIVFMNFYCFMNSLHVSIIQLSQFIKSIKFTLRSASEFSSSRWPAPFRYSHTHTVNKGGHAPASYQ